MHRPLKFATLVAVALAFTACADSARNPITEPNGLSLAKGTFTELSAAQLALWSAIDAETKELYCAGKLRDNAIKDVNKLRTYAEFGWWTAEDGAEDGAASHENVAYIAAKMIANNEANLAAGKTCGDQEVAEDLTDLINLFASQGASLDDPGAELIVCPETGCLVPGKVDVPPGTFGQLVAILVRTNNESFPDPNLITVGPSLLFDVLPATAVANNPWTRCLTWDGYDPGVNNENPGFARVQMVRQDENGEADFLPTTVNACQAPAVTMNPVLRGAYKLFAGFPLFPKDLHAYSPPRTFGGTSTAASPHFLTVFDEDDPFDALCQATYEISPPTANAGCTKLFKARECVASDDDACVNTELDSYIQVVGAAVPQKLTQEQADGLIAQANSLRPQQ